MDILISAVLLVILLPLLVLLGILICLDSPGSPLFMQPRVGRGCRIFTIAKFRSMTVGASSAGPYWTQDNDVRITRVGRVMRATSLDELPQLWNVLTGDMSFVGPRPDTPAQQTFYTPEAWQQRHRVRPGITGLAQVNGRSSLTKEERLHYDLAYAANPTLAMDARILAKTVWMVIRKINVN